MKTLNSYTRVSSGSSEEALERLSEFDEQKVGSSEPKALLPSGREGAGA